MRGGIQGNLGLRIVDFRAVLAERVRTGLAVLRIDTVIGPDQFSVVLRAYQLPAGMTYARMHDALKDDGFVIYAGQGNFAKTLFRISTMGKLSVADVDRLLNCLARLLR